MTDLDNDSSPTKEPIFTLHTRWWYWPFLAIFIAGGVWIIVDELQSTQPSNNANYLIGAVVVAVFFSGGAISFKHRVEVYADHIVSKSIFGKHRAVISEITSVKNSLDYIHIFHANKKCIIIPSYLKNFYKLRKHLKQICPDES